MSQIRKNEVRRAIVRAEEMLDRNASSYDTFEGVLNRGYVRALRTLIGLGEQFLAPGEPISRTAR